MNFLIADTFTDSLARLTAQEQKAAKTTAFDLQMDPSAPGLSFHKLDRAKDPNFWSVRVSADVRLIVHRTRRACCSPTSVIMTTPTNGPSGARSNAIRRPGRCSSSKCASASRKSSFPRAEAASSAAAKPKLFDNLRKFELMAFGVPEEWVDDVRAADEDTLFDVIAHLPQEAQEALLKLAVGEKPEAPKPRPSRPTRSPIPDALRRFRMLWRRRGAAARARRAWEKWAVFLHPVQAALVARDFSGPARVSGSAGTGKTIVALHRAVHLARANPAAKVLLTTFSDALAHALERKLKTLASGEPEVAGRIVVKAIGRAGADLYAEAFGKPKIVSPETVRALIAEAAGKRAGIKFSLPFLVSEWSEIIDPWLVSSVEDYGKVSRLGRKTRLAAGQREALWPIFRSVREALEAQGSRDERRNVRSRR